jgi:hypothetical protein
MALREAFECDLKSLPADIISLSVMNEKTACEQAAGKEDVCEQRIKLIKAQFKTKRGTAAITALAIADGIIGASKPVDILNAIANNQIIKESPNEVANNIRLANIILQSLLANDADKIWVTASDLNNKISDPGFANIFFGLVYQQIQNQGISFDSGATPFSSQMRTNPVNKIVKYVQDIHMHALDIERYSRGMKKGDTIDTDKLNGVLSSVCLTLNAASNLNLLSPAINISVINNIQTGIAEANKGIVIAQNIIAKNYMAAVMNSIVLISDIPDVELKKDDQFGAKSLKNPEPRSAKATSGADAMTGFKQQFAKYGIFVATIAAASGPKEIEKTLQAFALPAASAAVKKNTNFSIALQSYIGITAGKEAFDRKSSRSGSLFNSLAVYAPVGISASIGLKSWKNATHKINGGSLSIAASVIDVGAMVAYRFKEPQTGISDTVKVRFENIFAPGINLAYGFPKIPLSIGGGFQWQPSVTRFSNSKVTLTQQSGYRAQLFLGFDLPILNLYTSGN